MSSSQVPYGATVGGWTFDPSHEEWQARVGPSTWRIVRAPFSDPPRFAPAARPPQGTRAGWVTVPAR